MRPNLDPSELAADAASSQHSPTYLRAGGRAKSHVVTWMRRQLLEVHQDALRKMAEDVAALLIRADVQARLGAAPHERIGGRPRRWVWETRMGDIKLGIPRLRNNSYSPEWLLQPRHRAERAVVALLAVACVHVVPPGRVRMALHTLGIERLTNLQASELTARLNAIGAGFRKRPLDRSPYPYLALAARRQWHQKGRPNQRAVTAVATAVTPEGKREVVGVEVASDEEAALTRLVIDLAARGLSGVRLVVSEGQPALKSAIGELWPDAVWQLSPAELPSVLSSAVPLQATDMVASLVDSIYDQADRTAVEVQHARVVEQLKEAFPEAAATLSAARAEMLAFSGFPRAHWSLIWANVPFELINSQHAATTLLDRPSLFVVARETQPDLGPAAAPLAVVPERQPIPEPSIASLAVFAPEQQAVPAPATAPDVVQRPSALAPPVAEIHTLRRPRAKNRLGSGLALRGKVLSLAARPRPAVKTSPASGKAASISDRNPKLKNLASLAVFMAAIACIATTLPGAWIVVGTLVLGLSVAGLSGVNRQQLATVLLGVTVAATTVDYLAWRAGVANWSGWVIAAPLLVAEMFGALHTLGLQYTVFPSVRRQPLRASDPSRRPVFILIPTVDEGPSVLTPTIKAALEARSRYLSAFRGGRVTIVVCNDGRVAGIDNWRDVEQLARRLGVACITRTVGGGNKAGNLEHARQVLKATGDALVAIFDADQIAKPDFLLKTIPPFSDPAIGWVQTGQYYRNLDQPVARWANDQQALFYRVLCPGKEAHNAAFICGTNVVIRADALDEIGGLPQDSVTEDFAASIELHVRWRSVFLTQVLAEGLGPMDLPAYLRQQRRWAIGTISVLRTHWRAIFLPQKNGLRLDQRIQYFLACTHYLSGVRDLIYVLAPVAFLLTGIPAVQTATLGQFMWHFLPYWAASQGAFWYAARGVTSPRGIIIGFGSFPALMQALFTVVLGRRAAFMVTSKQRRDRQSWRHLVIYALALIGCSVAIGLAIGNTRLRRDSVAISVLWVLYDVALLAGVLWLGVMDLRVKVASQSRSAETAAGLSTQGSPRSSRSRVRKQLPESHWRRWRPWPEAAPDWARLGLQRGSSNPGAVALAVLLSLTVLFRISFDGSNPVVLAVDRTPGQPVYLGLSVPYQLLGTRPDALQNQLCLPFTIIGRTQDISDRFDIAWATRLSARNQRPWITLQFGNFGADGKPPLDASLPAIQNGVHDSELQRWAQEIHAYGKPVYLTILLHVDRNWSVSSAVANGGIPQDVPRVWEHVQSVFKAAGDTNVAWVWAPADPSQDQQYAPPQSTIDVVLQSMIRYPGTPWPDPTAVLSDIALRHPAKPLFVEVSGAGAPDEKATWLETVAAAVAADPQVYALMYHEGAPDVGASVADNIPWLVESDPSSIQAMLTWQPLVPVSTLPCRESPPAARKGA